MKKPPDTIQIAPVDQDLVTHAKTRPFEEWAKEKEIPDWMVSAAAAGHRWAQGREVDEASFDDAIAKTAGIKIQGA